MSDLLEAEKRVVVSSVVDTVVDWDFSSNNAVVGEGCGWGGTGEAREEGAVGQAEAVPALFESSDACSSSSLSIGGRSWSLAEVICCSKLARRRRSCGVG